MGEMKWVSAVKKVFGSPKTPKTPKSPKNAAISPPEAEKSAGTPAAKDDSPKVKQKKRWSFGRSKSPNAKAAACAGMEPSSKIQAPHPEKLEEDQSKNAIAVAVATAAAAEAAVAAAQAAAEVARLANIGWESACENRKKEEDAIIKIQALVRGFLARRRYRNSKAVVRLRALMKDNPVRRQSVVALKCMQALVRAQARIRARRVRTLQDQPAAQRQISTKKYSSEHHKSTSDEEGLEDWNDSLLTFEEIQAKMQEREAAADKRERALAYAFSHQLWRCSPNDGTFIDCDPSNPNWAWSWLDPWITARPWDSTDTKEDLKIAEDLKVESDPKNKSELKLGEKGAPNSNSILRSRINDETGSVLSAKSGISTARSAVSTTRSMISNARSMQSLHSNVFRPRSSSIADDSSSVSSFASRPNYMNFTKSAKAKARTVSTSPKTAGTPDSSLSMSSRRRLSFPIAAASSNPIHRPILAS